MSPLLLFFFFNDTATTEIYTLSLHDALPISAAAGPRGGGLGGADALSRRERRRERGRGCPALPWTGRTDAGGGRRGDRKSTRLNSSHANISYAVFCLKKKKILDITQAYTHYA